MKLVIIFATILFNGQVENLEYKGGVFKNQKDCTDYIASNGELISTTLQTHLNKVYPNSKVLIIACSDRRNFNGENNETST